MKRLGFVLVLIVAMVSLLVASCGGADEETTPTATATPGATVTGTPGKTPTPAPTDPVHFNDLIPLLPDAPPGWEADDPSGGTFQMEDWSWSQASNDYTNQTTNEYASVTIHDSAYYQGFAWFAAWEYAFEWETTEGYARSTTVKGNPAWKTYNKPDDYALMLLVSDRFLVIITAESEASLNQFADSIDFGGLAGLG